MQKYVLTGGPCSGKSTLMKMFEEKGIPVIHESARTVLKEYVGRELTSQERGEIQFKIWEAQMQAEKIYETHKGFIILDRCLVDVYAYSSYYTNLILPNPQILNLQNGTHPFSFLKELHFKKMG